MAGIASMVDLIFFVCSLSSLYYPAVCSHRDLILYTITVSKITAVQALCYIYRRQNYKHNSIFIPKIANLIEPKMWPLCMARNGGPSVDVRIHSWPRPTVNIRILSWLGLTVDVIARPTVDPQLAPNTSLFFSRNARPWAPQIRRLWERVSKYCEWGQERAPAVRLLWDVRPVDAVVEFLKSTMVGCRTATSVPGPWEVKGQASGDEDEEGGPGPL